MIGIAYGSDNIGQGELKILDFLHWKSGLLWDVQRFLHLKYTHLLYLS